MIETELSEKQRLLLWRLAVAGGGMWLSEIAGGLSGKPLRDGLIRSRLISEEKQEKKVPGKRTTRPLFIILEDRGWAWLSDHMDLPIWRSNTASDVLQGLVSQLRAYMDRQQIALGELLSNTQAASHAAGISDHQDAIVNAAADTPRADTPRAETPRADTPRADTPRAEIPRADTAVVRQEIAATYARLASKQSNSRVRLAAIRHELSEFAREDVDVALRAMLNDGEIVLNRLDNPAEITLEDEAAMIKTSLGDPRHIMHMELPVGSLY